MAFGAQIKLSVDRSNKASFRSEIQNFVDIATVNAPIRLKHFILDISTQQRQQIVDQLKQSIGTAELSVKVNRIDAGGALNDLRSQLATMLSGLQVGGLKTFLGSEGIESAYEKAGSAANRLAEATENVRQKTIATNSAIKELNLIQGALSGIYKSTINVGDSDKLAQYVAQYRELETAIQNAKTLEGDAQKEAVAGIASTTAALNQEIKAQLESEKAAAKKAATAGNAEQVEKRRAAEADRNARIENNLARQTIQLRQQINQYVEQNSTAYRQYSGEIDRLLSQLQNESGISAAQLSQISKEFAQIKTNAQESGLAGQTFFEKLQDGWAKFGGWAVVTKSMMSAQTQIRKMIDIVKELDYAMTELRKVTDLSETEYEAFFDNAIKSAKSVGATLSDTIVSSADFARLGYDVADADMLAKAALIYKNVGDGIENVSDASESLISTIKAFGFAAEDSMHIVDAFNEVGNNFAISSVGIGEALQRSASALSAANNTMEESIGLVVGMNNVLQNPAQVGTILKTSSMYLRAAKAELDEAGESTEGMAKSVSKLREDLLGLAGIDIQLDENTFKSTFQIYKELSEVWSSIKDIDQAAIVELIAGKRNASGVISLLTNFTDAENAMLAALDSFGSATQENEKYLESIAGKTALLQLAFETLSSSLISSDIVKGVIDIGTEILNLIILLQRLHLLLPLIAASITLIKGKKMLDEITGISQAVAPLTSQLVQQKQVTETLAASVSALSLKEKKQLAIQIQKAVATNELNNAQAKAILSSLGMATANKAATVSTISFKGAVSGLWAILKANPLGIVLTLASIAIPMITSLVQSTSRAAEEAIQKANEIKSAYAEAVSSSKNSISSLNAMKDQFDELSRGVDSTGKNVSLTNDQYNTYLSLVDQIINISPSVVTAYDSEGRAIVNYTNVLQDAVKEQQNYLENSRNIYIAGGKDLFDGGQASYNKAQQKLDNGADDIIKAASGTSKWTLLYNDSQIKKIETFTAALETLGIEYTKINGVLEPNSEGLGDDLYKKAADIMNLLRASDNYTVDELANIEHKIYGLAGAYTQLSAVQAERINYLMEFSKDQSWYASIPGDALDEFKTGLIEIYNPLLDYNDSMANAGMFGEEFARALDSDVVSEILKMSEAFRNGEITIEDYNAAVAGFGEAYKGSESSRNALLSYLLSLSNVPEAMNANGIISITELYEELSDTISDTEKSLKLLTDASKEMSENGEVSADTVDTLLSLLSAEEKLTDYISVQNGVIKFNTEAWQDRITNQYKAKIAELEQINTTLESSEATEESTQALAENNAMIGVYMALIRSASEATKESTDEIRDSYDKIGSAIDNLSKMGRSVEVTYDAYKSMVEMDKRYAGSLEYVNGMLTINREKHNEITEAKIAETLAMAKAELQMRLLEGGYQDLISRVGSLNPEEQKRLDNLNVEIMSYKVLANELGNATTAYQRFLNFSDTSSTNRYNTALDAYDIISKTLNDKTSDLYNKIGTDQFKLAVDYVLGENVEVNTSEFDRGLKLVKRYLANEGQNVRNFYDDLVKKGIIDSVTGAIDTTIVEVSEKLGISQELVRALFEELETYQEKGLDWSKLEIGSTKSSQEEVNGLGDAATSAQENVNTLSESIQTVLNDITTVNSTPVSVGTSNSLNNLGKVSSSLSDVIAKLNKIASISQINVNVNTHTTTSTASSSGSSLLGRMSGLSAASGTHKAVGGKTLVGELGMETVVDPNTNTWYTVGDNGAQFVNLPKGAVVFNADQTKTLFGAGRVGERGEAMLAGSASKPTLQDLKEIYSYFEEGSYANTTSSVTDKGVGTLTIPKTSSSSKKSSSKSSSSSEKPKDPFEELKKYYDDLLSHLEHLIEHQVFLYKQAERGLDYNGMELSLREQAKIYQDIMATAQKAVKELQAKGAKDTDSALQDMEEMYWGAYDDLNSVLDQINALYIDALTNKIDDVQKAYSNLANAADEFAKYGGISVDTFQALIANGVEYLSLLQDVDGQYTINKEGIQNIIAAQKEQLAIESAISYITQLRQALGDKDVNAVQNLVGLTNQISDASWDQVEAQLALLQALGLTEVQYLQVLNNINALKDISSSVITDIADGAVDLTGVYKEQENALDKLLELTQDLIEHETKQKIQAIKDQIEAYKRLINLKKESLQTTKEESKYEDNIAEKVQGIAKLQASIDQLSLDDSRAAIAERLSLMEELAKLQKELAEAQSNHAYDQQVDVLDKMAEAYEEERQSDIEALENSISSAEKLFQLAIERISTKWSTLYDDLIEWNTEVGRIINSEVTEHWNLASEAILKYGSYLQALKELRGIDTTLQATDSSVVADVLPKYHSGGIVGDGDLSQSKEIVAVLEKGEIVIDDQKQNGLYQIIDFQKELSKRLGFDIGHVGSSAIDAVYGNFPTNDIQRDITDNSSLIFNPNISVVINSNGNLSDGKARDYGDKIASSALDKLTEAMTRKGISRLGGAKLAPA